jgi:hypothetical protein
MSTILYEDENHKCVKKYCLVGGGVVPSYLFLIVGHPDIR